MAKPARRSRPHPKPPGAPRDALDLLLDRLQREAAAAGRVQVDLAEVLRAIEARQASMLSQVSEPPTEDKALRMLRERLGLVPGPEAGVLVLPGWAAPAPKRIHPPLL